MNLFKQIFIGSMFLASMYCSIIFLYMGEYAGFVLLGCVALYIFIEGCNFIRRQTTEKDNCEIHNKNAE
jgi:hypothetical protein